MTERSGMLVDTCALIALVNPNEPHHKTVRDYIEQAVLEGVELYVSALTVAEFAVRQDLGSLDQQMFIIEGFEPPEAALAGKMEAHLTRDPGDDRVRLKVDVMLIAHAEKIGVAGLLTTDANSMAKYARRLQLAGLTSVLPILATDPFVPAKIHNPAIQSFLGGTTH